MNSVVPAPVAAPSNRKLKRSMGLWMATALVVGNMIGSGVFLLPASLAGTAGPVSMFGWVFTGAGAMLLALVFANLGRALPAHRRPVRLRASARSATSSASRPPGATGSPSGPATPRSPSRSSATSPCSGPRVGDNNLLGALVGIALIWLLTAINILGARESGRVQLVTTVLKFVPLAVIGIVGLFFIDGGNYTPFAPHGAELEPAVRGRGADAVGVHRPRVGDRAGRGGARIPSARSRARRSSARSSRRCVYILATVAIMGIIPTDELADSTSPFADAAGQIFGGGWDKVIALVALVSTFGALNGWILLQGRVPLAAAEDGMFPRAVRHASTASAARRSSASSSRRCW